MGAKNSFLIRASLIPTIEWQLWRGEGGQDIGLRRLKFKNGCNERSFIFCKQSKLNVNKLGLSCAKLRRAKVSLWLRIQWLWQNVRNSSQICGAGGGGVVADGDAWNSFTITQLLTCSLAYTVTHLPTYSLTHFQTYKYVIHLFTHLLTSFPVVGGEVMGS